MNLGAFSISLTVKDINKSFKFYETLGFKEFGGDIEQGWLILKNNDHIIGLFQGMFDKNMLTFNPGWDQDAKETTEYMDVRKIKDKLLEQGIEIISDGVKEDTGPANIMITDPDGNPILIDQHR